MGKKSGVSLNFDIDQISKDIVSHVEKNKVDLPM